MELDSRTGISCLILELTILFSVRGAFRTSIIASRNAPLSVRIHGSGTIILLRAKTNSNADLSCLMKL